eukprot:scaffold12177_cov114-Isochrysis_galbana.AAC.4
MENSSTGILSSLAAVKWPASWKATTLPSTARPSSCDATTVAAGGGARGATTTGPAMRDRMAGDHVSRAERKKQGLHK